VNQGRRSGWQLVLLALAVGAAVAAFVIWRERIPAGVAWLQGRGLAGAVLVGLVYALATVLLLPASVLTLGVGFVYGPLWGTLIVSPASVLGASAAFLLGRTLLRERVRARVAGKPRWQALFRAIDARGLRILVLTRLSPLFPFVLLNYAFGLTRVRLLPFVCGSALAMLPGTVLYVWLGSTLEDAAQVLGGAPDVGTAGRVLKFAGLLATAGVTIYVTRLAQRTLREEAPDLAAAGRGDER